MFIFKKETPKPIAPKATVQKVPIQQVRNERQISSTNYNVPKPTTAPKVVAPKTSKYVDHDGEILGLAI